MRKIKILIADNQSAARDAIKALLFTWGAWLKHPNWIGLVSCLFATGAVWVTAKTEESENLAIFGERYRSYIERTRNFIPFLL